jgi:anaerobic selenocysteine-containing dehydrogenase
MTIRSEGQFNTVVYEEEDIFRSQTRRDVVLIHPNDMKKMQFVQDQQVLVRGEAGEITVFTRVFDIREGNCAMYYPEANVLLSNKIDQESKTPIFKGAVVELLSCVDV